MYRFTEWPYLVRVKPNAARDELIRAFRATGSVVAAAKALGIGRNTFYKHMKLLNMSYDDLLRGAAKKGTEFAKNR